MRKRVGFSIFHNRISPLFDVSSTILVVEYKKDNVVREETVNIHGVEFFERVKEIVSLKLDILICGGISRQYFEMLISYGIEVIPFISGEIEDIKKAYVVGSLSKRDYIMPGCFCHRTNILRRWKMQGRGMGGGSGRGRGGGRGMGGGRGQGKVDGVCVCPKCGYKEDHLRGFPCFEKMCPNCQIPLQRG